MKCFSVCLLFTMCHVLGMVWNEAELQSSEFDCLREGCKPHHGPVVLSGSTTGTGYSCVPYGAPSSTSGACVCDPECKITASHCSVAAQYLIAVASPCWIETEAGGSLGQSEIITLSANSCDVEDESGFTYVGIKIMGTDPETGSPVEIAFVDVRAYCLWCWNGNCL